MRSAAKSQVGRRYARALAALTDSRDEFQRLEGDLAGFARLLRERADLRLALYHPALGRDDRDRLLSRLLKAARPASQLTERFLLLLVRNRRLDCLEETLALWREIAEERLGLVSAEIITATPLADADRDRCRKTLEAITGREVRLETRTDPGLIGGARTRIGSQVLDGSIARQLHRMKQNFVEG